MRLFVAVELDAPVRVAAAEVAREMERRLRGAVQANWVAVGNLHLTVRFIGHVDDDRVPQVLEGLAPTLEIAQFDLALGGCGIFPPHGPPRVLWIGVREGTPSLQALHDEFNRRLLPLGFAADDRPFSAHLTLARVKAAARGSGARVREVLSSVRIERARSHVAEATIFESRLSPKGPTYVGRLRVPLGG